MLPEVVRFKNWLRCKSPNTSTHIHYASDLKIFFTWVRRSPQDVGVKDVDRFIRYCQGEGHAIATVNRRLASLRSFYQFLAVEVEDPPKNPVLPKRHFIRQGRRLPRDVQDADLERLFAVIDNPRDRAIFMLMLRCGLRVGEARNLSMQDLYLDPSIGNLPRLWLNGKGRTQRVVYLSPQPLTALGVWLQNRPGSDDPAVFLNRFGRRMTVTGIQDRLAHYCRLAGLWITCHQLRHTFGRHLTEARVPPTTIQRLLGHARLSTSELYLHVSDRQVQEDYDTAMEEIARRLPLEGDWR